jgi:hypothetical protein
VRWEEPDKNASHARQPVPVEPDDASRDMELQVDSVEEGDSSP